MSHTRKSAKELLTLRLTQAHEAAAILSELLGNAPNVQTQQERLEMIELKLAEAEAHTRRL